MVRSAQGMATLLGVSPMLIGFTAVALGTSAPELVVSVLAAIAGNPGVAVGNGIGSNLVNSGVVLGFTLVSAPMRVGRTALTRHFPLLALSTALLGYFLWDNRFSSAEGICLVLLFPLVLLLLVYWDSGSTQAPAVPGGSLTREVLVFCLMLGLLLVSADQLVSSSVSIAHYLGLSDLLIGLILVSIGTSLPELVVCVISIWRRAGSLALGNILGSNIFNIFGVLGLAVSLSPGYIHPHLFTQVYAPLGVMTVLMLSPALFLFNISRRGDVYLGRALGVSLLLCYCACVALLTAGDVGIDGKTGSLQD